jgi:23S rRNA (uridine2552-2'-O)-methyltransferase
VGGVDLAELEPLGLANAFSILGDFSDPAVLRALLDGLGGAADVVLCDAAPKLTGVRSTDRAREEALLEAVEGALPVLLRGGGDLLVKLLDCPEAVAFEKRTRSRFRSARVSKPGASRKGSTEKYLLARGFRG